MTKRPGRVIYLSNRGLKDPRCSFMLHRVKVNFAVAARLYNLVQFFQKKKDNNNNKEKERKAAKSKE